ncbi:VWA domain-containing protein [Candidatus Woesearchaeota archaeon]|nr:VWA domain-containing protein [Candidatus Woesearchaeota archaeon]
MDFLYYERLMYMIPLVIALIVITWYDFVKLKEKSILREKELRKRMRIQRILMFLSRSVIIILLVIALATPFMSIKQKLEGDRSLTILVDNSKSMEPYDNTGINNLKEELEKKLPVKLAYIGSGLRSNIGDGILVNLANNRNMLIATDGNNNDGTELGDVALFAADLNATLNVLDLDATVQDMSVVIEGPSKVLAESENEFKILVDSTIPLDQYRLRVLINDQEVLNKVTSGDETTFKQTFSEGYYKIEARVDNKDHFSENNVFYKAIHVVKKPKVLLVTGGASPLATVLEKLYDTEVIGTLEGVNPDKYYAVVLDDVSADSLSRDSIDRLSDFVGDGNGLVIVGGERSYEYGNYKGSLLSNLLPVKMGSAEKEPKPDLNAVILIDLSKGKEYTNLTMAKTRAYHLMDEFRLNDNVAVVAFADKYTVVSSMSKIMNKDMLEVKSKIAKLNEKDCMLKRTCSNIGGALDGVIDMLSGTNGRRYIFLLSDMDFGLGAGEIEYLSEEMKNEEIIIFPTLVFNFVVGDHFYKEIPPRLEINMIQFAEKTGGTAFFPKTYERMSFIFGKTEQEDNEEGVRNVVTYNAFHFITKDIEPSARIYGFNEVVPKSTARLLMTTTQGEPILTVGRHGLGRVAALSTDDGNSWSGQMFNQRNSNVISRIMNWAIGDPERKEDYIVNVDDTRVNKTTEIIVKSKKFPKAEGITFYKEEENIYTSKIDAGNIGFNEVLGIVYATNYDNEYQNLGVSGEIISITESSNGKIFKIHEIDEIVNHVIKSSERFDVVKRKMMWPFLAAGLIIFLVEVSIRRLIEQRQNG